MKKVLPYIIAAVVIVAAIAAFISYRRSQAARSTASLETVPAEIGSLTANVGATGTVRANQTAVLVWQTTGSIESVSVKTGDLVHAGDTLAALKQSSLPQSVIMAQGDLGSARQQLDDLLNSQLPYAQALQAQQDAQDAMDTYQANLSSQQADAQLALISAQDALTKAQNKRKTMNGTRGSQETIDSAQATYDKAQNKLDDAQRGYDQAANNLPADDPMRMAAAAALDQAKRERDKALGDLYWYQGNWSEKDISKSDADVQQAQATLDKAQHEFDRLTGTGESAQLALLQAQLADAQRKYESYKDGPPLDQVEALKSRIAAAEATIGMAQITAPFSGTVTVVSGMPGDQVSPGATALRIDDLSSLLVDVSVSEVDINRVQVGQLVSLTFDAILGKTYNGTVSEVSTVGTVTQGVVEFSVTVELTDADEQVRPGMTAAVNIMVQQIDNVLLVPNRAVRVIEGQRVVYVLRDNQVQQVNLELGASSDVNSEVTGGDLKEGDAIILNPPTNFTSGRPGFMR